MLKHPAIDSALDGSATSVSAVANELDDIYFDLQDQLDEGVFGPQETELKKRRILEAFGKARAAASLAFAIEGNAADAVYEAAACADDIQGLKETILRQL